MLLTPPGGAAIAVVRLVGAGVGEFLKGHFDKAVSPGRCVHGTLRDGGRVVDDAVVVVSGGGAVADLSVHGGPWVVRSVLELVRRRGFEVLDGVRAPVHEGLVEGGDEIAREVGQYLPLATTELALRALLAQPAAWQKIAGSESAGQCGAVLTDRSLYWLLHPPRVAIIGVPNVGKSTLANQLLARDRLITSNVAGTTRDWVGELANLDGLAVVLVDTPGVRETSDAIEREAIDRSREQVAAADLIILILDPSQPREPAQAALEREHPGAMKVINKSDLNRTGEWDPAIQTVATTGAGVDALRNAIRAQFLGRAPYEHTRRRWWTQRQRELLTRPRPATA